MENIYSNIDIRSYIKYSPFLLAVISLILAFLTHKRVTTTGTVMLVIASLLFIINGVIDTVSPQISYIKEFSLGGYLFSSVLLFMVFKETSNISAVYRYTTLLTFVSSMVYSIYKGYLYLFGSDSSYSSDSSDNLKASDVKKYKSSSTVSSTTSQQPPSPPPLPPVEKYQRKDLNTVKREGDNVDRGQKNSQINQVSPKDFKPEQFIKRRFKPKYVDEDIVNPREVRMAPKNNYIDIDSYDLDISVSGSGSGSQGSQGLVSESEQTPDIDIKNMEFDTAYSTPNISRATPSQKYVNDIERIRFKGVSI